MEIAAGTRFGPYEIGPMLGAGGMGAVYRARDTRLNRSVAIKVLPAALSADPHMRERLAREARAISALSHPNICALYDVGSADGVDYLVMELVDGETLAQRLTRGPLPVAQAVAVGIDIALALDAAHRAGLIHRDLKPGNIMLTRTGARLLDFGLAKIVAPAPVRSLDVQAPTAAAPLTRDGFVVGTLQYMAPEQVEGRDLDARTDIFAFGLVLYEMLAGHPAFAGTSERSLLGAILTSRQIPLTTIAPEVSPELERIVDRCLEKIPDDRWQSARDLAEALRWTRQPAVAALPERTRRRALLLPGIGLLAALLGVAGALTLTRARPSQSAPPIRFSVAPPAGLTFAQRAEGTQLAVSPDGKMLVFAAHEGQRSKLFLRRLDELQARPLEGTDGAAGPFWSPDSRWIAFFSNGLMRKVRVEGGPVETICPAQGGSGSWNADGEIIFFQWGAEMNEAIKLIDGNGRALRDVTDVKMGWSLWPSFLPDGKRFVFFGLFHTAPSGLYMGSIEGTARPRLILPIRTRAEVRGDSIFYVRDSVLVRQRFDAERAAAVGDATPIAEQVFSFAPLATSNFSVSADGSVTAWQRTASTTQLVWRDWSGRLLGSVGKPEHYRHFALSPDGRRIAADISDPKTHVSNISTFDLQRQVTTRATAHPGGVSAPLWLRSGNALVVTHANPLNLSEAPSLAVLELSDGTVRKLREGDGVQYATGLTAGDRRVIYTISRGRNRQIEMVPVAGGESTVLSNGEHDESDGVISPDNRWLAYTSDQSGRPEVYIRPFATKGETLRVSGDGGSEPEWSDDGRTLLFLNPSGLLMRAAIGPGERPEIGQETVMFSVDSAGMMEFVSLGTRRYLVAGDRILVREIPGRVDADPVIVLVNAPR